MKLERFGYRVLAHIVLTDGEVAHLSALSASHYDAKCHAASQPGGFIYGWAIWIGHVEPFEPGPKSFTIDSDQAQTICKILEQRGEPSLSVEFHVLLSEMMAESERRNHR